MFGSCRLTDTNTIAEVLMHYRVLSPGNNSRTRSNHIYMQLLELACIVGSPKDDGRSERAGDGSGEPWQASMPYELGYQQRHTSQPCMVLLMNFTTS